MVEAVRVSTRYDLADKNGETRRERNKRLNIPTPEFVIPKEGVYLWDIFHNLNECIHRIDFNGYYRVMPPSEILAWCNLTNVLINENEYDILSSMDVMFCKELNAEITAEREKEEEKRKRQAEAERAKARIRRR